MKIKDMKVSLCERKEIRDFIEEWHYSKNINGLTSTYCFKLTHNDELIGGMIYGKLGMANVYKKYVNNIEELLELKRLCCIDNTPKNTESFFISKTLKWLKKNTDVKIIISYADPFYGHDGIIYRASNFEHVGFTSKGKVIKYKERIYHDKTIRTRYKGKLKPFAIKIKNALESGSAKYIKTPSKWIYVYNLKRKRGSGRKQWSGLNKKNT